MTHADAEAGVEMPQAMAEGSDQKSREYVNGVSNATAMKESSWTKARTRLMEQAVSRDNMMAAYHRVRSNQGASGIDGMTVGELKAHLVECWPRIREELLDRITSYNVCYTKLLRDFDFSGLQTFAEGPTQTDENRVGEPRMFLRRAQQVGAEQADQFGLLDDPSRSGSPRRSQQG